MPLPDLTQPTVREIYIRVDSNNTDSNGAPVPLDSETLTNPIEAVSSNGAIIQLDRTDISFSNNNSIATLTGELDGSQLSNGRCRLRVNSPPPRSTSGHVASILDIETVEVVIPNNPLGDGTGGNSSSTTIDFRGATALPSDWTKSDAATLSFSPNGMEISAGTGLGSSFVFSPIISMVNGRNITIDFIATDNDSAVGVADVDSGSIFVEDNAAVQLGPSGALFTGSSDFTTGFAYTGGGYEPNRPMRIRLIVFDNGTQNNLIVRFFHDLGDGNGYVPPQTGQEIVIPLSPALADGTRVYLDAGQSPLIVRAVSY